MVENGDNGDDNHVSGERGDQYCYTQGKTTTYICAESFLQASHLQISNNILLQLESTCSYLFLQTRYYSKSYEEHSYSIIILYCKCYGSFVFVEQNSLPPCPSRKSRKKWNHCRTFNCTEHPQSCLQKEVWHVYKYDYKYNGYKCKIMLVLQQYDTTGRNCRYWVLVPGTPQILVACVHTTVAEVPIFLLQVQVPVLVLLPIETAVHSFEPRKRGDRSSPHKKL